MPEEPKEEMSEKKAGTTLRELTPAERIKVLFVPGICAFGAAIIVGLIVALAIDARIFQRLTEPGYARGMITFLISVATIALAFVLVFQALLGGTGEDTETGYRRSREIFFGLMGVLGTIVGFYFGSAERGIVPLEIVEVRATEQQVLARVQGGIAPYGYVITYIEYGKPDSKMVIKGVSKDGWIAEDLKPSANPKTDITVDVTDNKQQKTSNVGKVIERTPPAQKPAVGEEKAKLEGTSPPQSPKK